MVSSMARARLLTRALLATIAALAAILVSAIAVVDTASAHGSVVDPATRNYGCWDRWGDDHLNPEMQTVDPMCWQAWQDNPNAMWNWNGLYRDGLGPDYKDAIPEGTLCSGGNAENGRYDSLDAIGPWVTTAIDNAFTVRLFDGASHGADWIEVYATRQGFDALNEPLGWDDLELVGQIGNTPASEWDQVDGGVAIDIPASAPARTGRHIVYTVWLASHFDQKYFLCSDVTFGDGPTSPPSTPPTSAPPSSQPPQSPSAPPSSPAPSSPPANAGCTATYQQGSAWNGGFQGGVEVTAGSAAISGWSVTIAFPSGQEITQHWNADLSQTGPSTYTAGNANWNGSLGAGGSASFGFLGSGTAATPELTCTAT